MKIDITALREAANKFATTLDAHRANPRDALAVTEWDEATSALTDIVGGDENNIIVALFDHLEAERQRAEAAEAELAELRSAQEPVGIMDVQHGREDGNLFAIAFTKAGHALKDDVYELFTRPAKPVVVLSFDQWCESRGEKPLGWVRDAMKEAYSGALEAAGIVVKDGE